jgi:hypothetical protein
MTVTRARACDGKHPYPDRKSALDALFALARDSGAAFWRLNAYRCRWCRSWHIGHSGRANGRRRKP